MSRELAKMNLISVVQQLPKEDIETIQGYVEMIELEEYKEMHKTMATFSLHNEQKIDELENQQKEFISYLENEIKRLENYMKEIRQSGMCQGDYPITYYKAEYKIEAKNKLLLKYKEIIGGKEE